MLRGKKPLEIYYFPPYRVNEKEIPSMHPIYFFDNSSENEIEFLQFLLVPSWKKALDEEKYFRFKERWAGGSNSIGYGCSAVFEE